jgi:hypothetical protein
MEFAVHVVNSSANQNINDYHLAIENANKLDLIYE